MHQPAQLEKKKGGGFFCMIKAYANRKVLIYANCNKLQGLAITGRSAAVVHAVECRP